MYFNAHTHIYIYICIYIYIYIYICNYVSIRTHILFFAPHLRIHDLFWSGEHRAGGHVDSCSVSRLYLFQCHGNLDRVWQHHHHRWEVTFDLETN